MLGNCLENETSINKCSEIQVNFTNEWGKPQIKMFKYLKKLDMLLSTKHGGCESREKTVSEKLFFIL